MDKREFQTTEFWTVAVGLALWLVDRYAGVGVLDGMDPDQAITEARAQVLAIAAQLRAATGSESGLILYVAGGVYLLRKLEKIAAIWRRADVPAAER